jgi:hypothetical protein
VAEPTLQTWRRVRGFLLAAVILLYVGIFVGIWGASPTIVVIKYLAIATALLCGWQTRRGPNTYALKAYDDRLDATDRERLARLRSWQALLVLSGVLSLAPVVATQGLNGRGSSVHIGLSLMSAVLWVGLGLGCYALERTIIRIYAKLFPWMA